MNPIQLTNQYVIAVSGGVDSMTLLDLILKGTKNTDLIIVAHVDHNIRIDSGKDLQLVSRISRKHNLKFYSTHLNLEPHASEEKARLGRYQFLNEVVLNTGAEGLITAHHQDDLIETILINLIRGTNRKGLTSLASNHQIYRPLLNYSKKAILSYALKNDLKWREDSTNKDTDYLRNYLRLQVLNKLQFNQRRAILNISENQKDLNRAIDTILDNLYRLKIKNDRLDRLWFNAIDFKTQKELLSYWLRRKGLREFNLKQIERTVNYLKVARSGAIIEVSKGYTFDIDKDYLALRALER